MIKYIIGTIATWILAYLCISFYELQINAAQWSEGERLIYIFLIVMSTYGSVSWYNIDKN